MKLKINYILYFKVLSLLLIYFLGSSSAFLIHSHNHSHSHSHSHAGSHVVSCDLLFKETCHNSHLSNNPEKCIFCDNIIVAPHLFSSSFSEYLLQIILEKNERIVINYSVNLSSPLFNKGPPYLS